MRTLWSLFIIAFIYPNTFAQDYVEEYSYASNETMHSEYGLPIVRTIYGGTKIIPIFEGEWPENAKGAFEYACKIWEEVMPTTYPIRIKAIWDNTNSSSALSKMRINSIEYSSDLFSIFSSSSLWTQIKGTTFLERTGTYDSWYYSDALNIRLFQEPDMEFTYFNMNDNIVDNCSFFAI